MKREAITMLQLRPDPWGPERAPLDQVPAFAGLARKAVTSEGVREWIEVSDLSHLEYRNLIWVLEVISCAKVAQPRRLTWWERVTGRLQA